MRISSVNVGKADTISHGRKSIVTGICKQPVSGSVLVTELGLCGDAVVNEKHHGGPDQAVYAYGTDDYDWWRAERGGDFAAGLFGENLTIEGLPSDLYVGDRMLIGGVVLEATSPRIPCATLAARLADPGFGLAFRKAERPGIYFRVLNAGEVCAGDTVTLVQSDASTVTTLDLFRFAYATQHDADTLRRYLEAPVAERMKAKIEVKLSGIDIASD